LIKRKVPYKPWPQVSTAWWGNLSLKRRYDADLQRGDLLSIAGGLTIEEALSVAYSFHTYKRRLGLAGESTRRLAGGMVLSNMGGNGSLLSSQVVCDTRFSLLILNL
jgi:hypothetical protein